MKVWIKFPVFEVNILICKKVFHENLERRDALVWNDFVSYHQQICCLKNSEMGVKFGFEVCHFGHDMKYGIGQFWVFAQ